MTVVLLVLTFHDDGISIISFHPRASLFQFCGLLSADDLQPVGNVGVKAGSPDGSLRQTPGRQ